MKIKYNTTIVLMSMLLFGCANKQQRLIDKADAYYNKGIDLSQSRKATEAIDYFDSALMFHQRAEYYVMRGLIRSELKDYKGAIDDFENALIMDSISPAAFYATEGLWAIYVDNDEYAKAIEYAERANKLKPFTVTFFDIGGMYYRIDDYKNALINFGQAITTQTASQPIETAYMMADCYMRLGDIKSAKEYWIATDSLGYQPSRLKLDSLKRIGQ